MGTHTNAALSTDTPAVGALWYKTILQSSTCPENQNALVANYSLPPDGFDTGTDQLNYAVVLESGASGYSLQAYSNGVALTPVNLNPGLNYGAFTGVQAGYQRMELLQGGAVVLAATGGRCISAGCPNCIYNMNPQVIPLIEDTGAQGTCPYAVCNKQVFAHYMVRPWYTESEKLTLILTCRLKTSTKITHIRISMMRYQWASMDFP